MIVLVRDMERLLPLDVLLRCSFGMADTPSGSGVLLPNWPLALSSWQIRWGSEQSALNRDKSPRRVARTMSIDNLRSPFVFCLAISGTAAACSNDPWFCEWVGDTL